MKIIRIKNIIEAVFYATVGWGVLASCTVGSQTDTRTKGADENPAKEAEKKEEDPTTNAAGALILDLSQDLQTSLSEANLSADVVEVVVEKAENEMTARADTIAIGVALTDRATELQSALLEAMVRGALLSLRESKIASLADDLIKTINKTVVASSYESASKRFSDFPLEQSKAINEKIVDAAVNTLLEMDDIDPALLEEQIADVASESIEGSQKLPKASEDRVGMGKKVTERLVGILARKAESKADQRDRFLGFIEKSMKAAMKKVATTALNESGEEAVSELCGAAIEGLNGLNNKSSDLQELVTESAVKATMDSMEDAGITKEGLTQAAKKLTKRALTAMKKASKSKEAKGKLSSKILGTIVKRMGNKIDNVENLQASIEEVVDAGIGHLDEISDQQDDAINMMEKMVEGAIEASNSIESVANADIDTKKKMVGKVMVATMRSMKRTRLSDSKESLNTAVKLASKSATRGIAKSGETGENLSKMSESIGEAIVPEITKIYEEKNHEGVVEAITSIVAGTMESIDEMRTTGELSTEDATILRDTVADSTQETASNTLTIEEAETVNENITTEVSTNIEENGDTELPAMNVEYLSRESTAESIAFRLTRTKDTTRYKYKIGDSNIVRCDLKDGYSSLQEFQDVATFVPPKDTPPKVTFCFIPIRKLSTITRGKLVTYDWANLQENDTNSTDIIGDTDSGGNTLEVVGKAPSITNGSHAPATDSNVERMLFLTYEDPDSDLAVGCETSLLNHVVISTSCVCETGICSLGVKSASNFVGEGSFGVRIQDEGNAWSEVKTISINFLSTAGRPILTRNTGIKLDKGARSAIGPMKLDSTHDSETPPQLTYILRAKPQYGDLMRMGVPLINNDTFTQKDINNGIIMYKHAGETNEDDFFQIELVDSKGNFATLANPDFNARFDILVEDFCTGKTLSSYKSAGSGTESEPYMICNKTQFDDFAANCGAGAQETCNGYFEVRADIDFAETPNITVGNGTHFFNGNFNGNGHLFKNITKNTTGPADNGLFYKLGSSGKITRVGILGAAITTANSKFGALVGQNLGVVEESFIESSTITVEPSSNLADIGGLVGLNGNTVIRTWGNVSMEVNSEASAVVNNVGILVGKSAGPGNKIIDSRAFGSISHTSTYNANSGGIVGAANASVIKRVASSASISTGGDHIGGLVGDCDICKIEKAYAMGSIAGETKVGGLVGFIHGDGFRVLDAASYVTITNLPGNYVGGLFGYANSVGSVNSIANALSATTLPVSAIQYLGGMAGAVDGTAVTISNVYIDSTLAFTGDAAGNLSNISGVTAKTTSNLAAQGDYVGWDFVEDWYIDASLPYAVLMSVATPVFN